MIFKIITVFVAVVSVQIFGADQSCDPSKCPTMPKHYEELGCSSVKKNGECCPSSYDCKHLEDRNDKKCYLKGQTFEAGESVNNSLLSGSCDGSCFCNGNTFTCAHLDCAEFFGPPLEFGCVRKYSNDQCCAIQTVCEEESIKLATCDFQGKTYKEGQRMLPDDNNCWKCICTNDFENKPVTSNKDCVKVNCNIELHEIENVKSGCIPIYHKDRCCPYDWRCPTAKDALIPGKQDANNIKEKCKFGKLELNVGDTLSEGENGCSICKCLTPPMASCVFSPGC